MNEQTVGARDNGAGDNGVLVSRRGMSKEQYGNRNNDGRMSDDPTLAGYRIGITSSRRADELANMLKRHGAVIESAPALMTLSCAEDVQLRDATKACIEAPPDLLIANTGVGMKGWFEAATQWGLGAKVVESLGAQRSGLTPFFRSMCCESRLVARGSGQEDWSNHDEQHEASHSGAGRVKTRAG